MYLNDDITQRSPLFRELIRWIDQMLAQEEEPPEDDELATADWIDREAAEE